jgi:hypothetical protein
VDLQFRVEFIPVNGDLVIFDPKDARPSQGFMDRARDMARNYTGRIPRSPVEAVSVYQHLKEIVSCMLVKCEGRSDILSYYCPERRARMCVVGYVKRGKLEEVYLLEFPNLL